MKKNLLRSILAAACALCLGLGLCSPAAASSVPIGQGAVYMGTATFDYAVVSGTSTLNLRAGPGSDYAWLGSAKEGDWVGLINEVGNWYYVCLPDSGLFGYMSKNFLSRSDSAEGYTTGVVSNPKTTQFLNLRQYPSYAAPVLGIYYNGAAFRLLSAADGWYQVEIGGQVGYFRQEYVRLSGSTGTVSAYVSTANGGKLNLRNAPSYKNSSIIAQFVNGSTVTVLHRGNTFWKVTIGGVTGYADSSFLRTGTAPSPTPSQRPGTKGYAIVSNPKATQYLNLRAQPSLSAKVVAQYKNGIRLEVVAQGETWCQVYGSASGNTGYIMTQYLRLYGLPSTPTKTIQNGATYVNLRSAPSKRSGTIYQRLYSGAVVTVLTPGDEWTQVRYNGITGYVMTAFLK